MSAAMSVITGVVAGAPNASKIIAGPLAASDLDVRNASASIRYKASGVYQAIQGGAIFEPGNWVAPIGKTSEWEIRATLVSGVTPTGTLNTWLALTTDRTWGISRGVTGLVTSNLTFEFRRVGDTLPEVTITNNILEAEVL